MHNPQVKYFKRGEGTSTPWGRADYRYKYCSGINSYGTPGHGGFKVSAKMLAKMPEALRNPDGWYEEDCEACKVIIAFPHLFDAGKVASAQKSFDFWFNSDGTYKAR